MCFISKKKFSKLQESVEELTSIVKTQEFNRLREESKEFKEVKELLSKIHFNLKDVKVIRDEINGSSDVRIRYELPTIVLKIDDEGNPNKNDFFYATNMLELISVEDMQKIQNILNEEKIKKI